MAAREARLRALGGGLGAMGAEERDVRRWWLAKNEILIEHRSRFLVLGFGLCLIATYYSATIPRGGRMLAYFFSPQADVQLQLAFGLGGVFLFLGLWGYKLYHEKR